LPARVRVVPRDRREASATSTVRRWLRIAALLSLSMTAAAAANGPDYSEVLDRLWDYEAPAASEQRFRTEIGRLAAGSREALEATTQLARALGLQRRFADADAKLDEVAAKLGTVPARVHVRYLLERGRTRNSSGAPAQAVLLFAQALDESARDTLPGAEFYRVDALHMLGIAAPKDAQLDWNRQALAAAEAASDARARNWRGSLLHNLGWTLHERGDYEGALAYWQRALAVREAAGDVPRMRIAKWTVARGLRSLGRLDEAERIQRALAAETESARAPDGYIYEELAEIALARNDEAAAKPWAAKAYAQLKQDIWLTANEPERLARLARIGGVAP
jgi:tetratricopeptide (TPR) repeat protein